MSRAFLQATNKLEKRYTPALIRIITAYRKQFISNYRAHGHSYAVNRLNDTALHPRIANILKDIYKVSGLMGARMTHDELKKLATQKAGGFGRNETWIRDVQNYLRLHLLNFVSDISDTMRQDILNILEKAVEEGWSIEETVKQLSSSGLIEARARVIARTEIVRAANVGHSVAAASLPYEVDKKWSAAKDHRTRHSHVQINGHIVGEDETFRVAMYKGDKLIGHEQMMYPGDPNASPGNTINCRCRALYIPKRDSNGNLVMRNPNQARVVPMHRVPRLTPAQIAAQLKSQIEIGIEK